MTLHPARLTHSHHPAPVTHCHQRAYRASKHHPLAGAPPGCDPPAPITKHQRTHAAVTSAHMPAAGRGLVEPHQAVCVLPNGLRFTCTAKRSGAASAGCACWAARSVKAERRGSGLCFPITFLLLLLLRISLRIPQKHQAVPISQDER
jgi:hypothetical protein